jgi:hypothetical protein
VLWALESSESRQKNARIATALHATYDGIAYFVVFQQGCLLSSMRFAPRRFLFLRQATFTATAVNSNARHY